MAASAMIWAGLTLRPDPEQVIIDGEDTEANDIAQPSFGKPLSCLRLASIPVP
jgi:hypothetical protein